MRKSVEARKQQILQAALSIFEKNGFEAATVDEIVARAGVSKGLAYHYFRSKDSILHEIIVRRLDELDQLTGRLQAETSAAKRLRILVGQLVTELTEGERRQRFLITTFLHPRNNRLV